MIDEKTLLIEKLKDNAVTYLAEKLVDDLGKSNREHQEMLEKRLYEWVSWAVKYYSTTDIRRAYAILSEFQKPILNTISDATYEAIQEIDPFLDLRDISSNLSYNRSLAMARQVTKIASLPNTIPPLKNTKKKQGSLKKLTTLIKNFKGETDKRRMRRLKRKEAQRKKKGVRLFAFTEIK